MPVMQDYVQRAPGSFTEEKTSTLGWHYRTVEPRLASKLAPGLLSQLREIAPGLGLSILNGDRVIEAKPGNFSKGTVTRYWLGQQNWDFTLAAGDDVTDEDLFAAMPPSAHTVKIGPGATNAQTRLPDPSAMLKLLDSLAKT
jgi:trehalose 6-phosphate synthase/phosphatase